MKPQPTPERLRELLRYDPQTGGLTWLPRKLEDFPTARAFAIFQTRCAGKSAFTADKGDGYRQGTVEGYRTTAHRVIWAMQTGRWPAGVIDHINHVRGDNRWDNLRLTDCAGNSRNRQLHPKNKSGRTGVRWHRWTSKWIATGCVDGKPKQLAHTENFEDACAARDEFEAASGYHENHGMMAA